jgi:hypothetical protein
LVVDVDVRKVPSASTTSFRPHRVSILALRRNGNTVLAAQQLFEDVLLCAAKGKGKGKGKGKAKTKTIEGVGGRGAEAQVPPDVDDPRFQFSAGDETTEL